MRLNDNDIPHIQACCSGCGFLFDLKYGTDCPSCHHVGVKWARLVSEQEAREPMHKGYPYCSTCNADVSSEGYCTRPTCTHSKPRNYAVDLDPDATREVIWCEKLFALDNEGSTR